MGMIETFVSSDPESIAMGGKWLEDITHGLKNCVIEIVLASPQSVKRPWINFEAGAGWVRDIPVIPICHSGMTPDTLPAPLSSLQAALASDQEQMERVLAVLAKKLECKMPQDTDCSEFIEQVRRFEEESRQLSVAQTDALLTNPDGFAPHEVATLVAAAECTQVPGAAVWPRNITERMSDAGYRDIAASLGLASLRRKGLIETEKNVDGYDPDVTFVIVNANGWAWLESNVDVIQLEKPTIDRTPASPDDIPF